METESHLIKKAIDGDENSFTKIVETYKNYVYAIILNFIKDYNEVENVAQEVFLQIYISLPKYENDNFKGWIGRITTNKALDYLRKKKAKFKDEDLNHKDEIYETEDQSKNPEQLLIEQESKGALMRVIDSIPDIYKQSLIKFYFQEKSYEQIAKEEDLTVKTIASRLYRAKILLREKWREENDSL